MYVFQVIFLEACPDRFFGLSKKNILELAPRNLLKNVLCGHGCIFQPSLSCLLLCLGKMLLKAQVEAQN